MVRQRLPSLDVAQLGLGWTKSADVVVCRKDSLKQLVTRHRRKSLRQQDTTKTRLLYDMKLCKLIVISVINFRITNQQSYRTA